MIKSAIKKILFTILIFSSFILGENKKQALVLSGGGARAFAHIGVLKALEENKWNRTKAAKALGITYSALRYKTQKYGIH